VPRSLRNIGKKLGKPAGRLLVRITVALELLAALSAVAAEEPPTPLPAPVNQQANAAPGAAPGQPQQAEAERERAGAAFQEALEAFQVGDFETAKKRYEEAYRLAPHPSTLYNLALACERLLDYEAAIAAFKRFLDEPLLREAEAARLQETRRLLAERALRRLQSLPARVSISAVPDPVTAEVVPLASEPGAAAEKGLEQALEQEQRAGSRCETPCIVTVPAGRYRLKMRGDGYFADQVDFEAHVGQALLISRQLRPRPRRVQIESQPRARIYLDDRLLGETPYTGDVPLGSHRLRLERRFYLTQLKPLDLGPGPSRAPLRVHVGLELSGRGDMIVGGAVAGAGLGLMVLRLFLGEEIETLPRQEIYKPLAAATLPAVLGASVAGFAGWEMPVSEAQLLIGSAGWGTLIGFGLGLGCQPQGPLPHVLAIGGGLIGGTLGTAAYRFVQPGSGPAAVFNSVALWSSLAGALGWAYLISDRPETAFYGQPSAGRSGEGGWVVFGSALGGVALGIGLSKLPGVRELSRTEVALVDLGAALGGLSAGALGMSIGYLRTGSWTETAHIAVPSTLAGIGVGLVGGALLVSRYHQRRGVHEAPQASTPRSLASFLPQLSMGRDLGGGMSVEVGILDGRF